MVPLREELIGARGEVRNCESASVIGRCHTGDADEQHHGASDWLAIGAEGYSTFNGGAALGVDRWRQAADNGKNEYENLKMELADHGITLTYNCALRENWLS